MSIFKKLFSKDFNLIKKALLLILAFFSFSYSAAYAGCSLQVNGSTIMVCTTGSSQTMTLSVSGPQYFCYGAANMEVYWYKDGVQIDAVSYATSQGQVTFSLNKTIYSSGNYSATVYYYYYDISRGQCTYISCSTNSMRINFSATGGPSASMKINNQTSTSTTPINISCIGNIDMDGSATVCETAYFLEIAEFDPVTQTVSSTNYVNEWFSGEAGTRELKSWCASKGFTLQRTKTYKVKLATGGTWTESSQYIYMEGAVARATINNLSGSSHQICYGENINLDANGTTCESNWYLEAGEIDLSTYTYIGTAVSEWFSGPAGTKDVKAWAAGKGLTFQAGKNYRVRVATNPEWTAADNYIYIKPVTASWTVKNSSNFYVNPGSTYASPTTVCNGSFVLINPSASSCETSFNLRIVEVSHFTIGSTNYEIETGGPAFNYTYNSAAPSLMALQDELDASYGVTWDFTAGKKYKITLTSSGNGASNSKTGYIIISSSCKSDGNEAEELVDIRSRRNAEMESSSNISISEDINVNCFPNPFQGTTSIQYTLPAEENITLTIYNSVGQVVDILVNGISQQPGTYTYKFDAKNNAKGIYLYELRAGNQRITGRMVLTK